MKLEIKKIALIMAAGVFAFSGAFGALGGLGNKSLESNNDEVRRLEVLNKLAKADIEVTLSPVGKVAPSTITVEPNQKEGNDFFLATSGEGIELTLVIKKKVDNSGITTGPIQQEQKIEMKFTAQDTKEQILNKIVEKAKMLAGGRMGAVKITPKVENNTLILTVTQSGVQQSEQI